MEEDHNKPELEDLAAASAEGAAAYFPPPVRRSVVPRPFGRLTTFGSLGILRPSVRPSVGSAFRCLQRENGEHLAGMASAAGAPPPSLHQVEKIFSAAAAVFCQTRPALPAYLKIPLPARLPARPAAHIQECQRQRSLSLSPAV